MNETHMALIRERLELLSRRIDKSREDMQNVVLPVDKRLEACIIKEQAVDELKFIKQFLAVRLFAGEGVL